MNILLVYPKTPGTFWNFKHILKFVSRRAAFPPLGLLTIAPLLPNEWKKRLIDLNVSKLRAKDIAWADLVLISAMIIQRDSAKEIIARCRAKNKTILAGGPLFTARPEDFPDIDHIFLGEAENTLPEFISDWTNGHPKKIYRSESWPDIRQTPSPMWSLINLHNYVTITVQYSRGCPYDCDFCDIIILNGRKPRPKTPEQFIREINELYVAGWRSSIFIADDNLIGNRQQVKLMLLDLIDWQENHQYPFRFLTQASVNLADDDELLDLMSKANFSKVFLGIETTNIASLEECGKTQNLKLKDVAAAVTKIQEHGLLVMGGFIVGFDHDPEDIFEQQKMFIESTGITVAMVGLLTALPGTALYKRLKGENRLTGESSGANTEAILNFIPKMNKDKLIREYKKLVLTLYGARSYYGRINKFFQDYRPTIQGGSLSWSHIAAFLKSMLFIGVFSPAAYYYWHLIIKTVLIRPRVLPTAVELAIQGHHFRIMSKSI
jgi:radical SAM superfamily enzyme YgiQ (UPF0313 family)